jgi:hypothetical protein
MEHLEITDPEDWHNVKSKLRLRCFQFPQFLHDYDRMCMSIELKIKDLCIIDIEIKRHNDSLYYQQLRKNKVDEINETLKTFSKILLLATLAKR